MARLVVCFGASALVIWSAFVLTHMFYPVIERLDTLEMKLAGQLQETKRLDALEQKLLQHLKMAEGGSETPATMKPELGMTRPVGQFWLTSYKCGEYAALPDGTVAGCDPNGEHPCCGAGGWCGGTPAHCGCETCVITAKKNNVERRARLKAKQAHIPGSDGTYSQNYQDVWFVRLAQRNGWPLRAEDGRGFFLDLGAFHGVFCSNSALLERKYNWEGICVEPLPKGFEQRSCTLAARALSDQSDQVVKIVGLGQEKKIGSANGPGEEVMTISIKQLLNCVNGTASQNENCDRISGRRRVPNFIHFASLDIEGMEPRLLRTFPWDTVKVAVWVMEINAPGRSRQEQDEARNILTSRGYMKAPVQNPGVDEYWVLPEFWDDSLKDKQMRVHPAGSEGC